MLELSAVSWSDVLSVVEMPVAASVAASDRRTRVLTGCAVVRGAFVALGARWSCRR